MSAQPRYATPRNLTRDTVGPEVCLIAECLYGFSLMPWQREIADVMYELSDDGTLHYEEARITTPRQSGKTTFTLARQIHRMLRSEPLGWGARPQAIYTAQTAQAARNKLVYDWSPIVRGSAYITSQGSPTLRLQNGDEGLSFRNGGRIKVAAPNATSGHGLVTDLVDIDEAFSYLDARAEQALSPGMITRPSPQLVITSTAGDAKSTYLWGKTDDGRALVESGADSTVCYFEYSAADSMDRADPATWRSCMPALGHTITEKRIQQRFDTLPPEEFDRAYLNRWTNSVSRVIPAIAWDNCLDSTSSVDGKLWMAVDASPGVHGGRTGSIAIAGRNASGYVHVEVIQHEAGLSWVADRIGELTRKHHVEALYVDTTGPIQSVFPDIQHEANTDVVVTDMRQMSGACVRFHEAVMTGQMRHLGQSELDLAVDGAAKRDAQDSWAWTRRNSTTDISPLVAATLAHWACAQEARPTEHLMFF